MYLFNKADSAFGTTCRVALPEENSLNPQNNWQHLMPFMPSVTWFYNKPNFHFHIQVTIPSRHKGHNELNVFPGPCPPKTRDRRPRHENGCWRSCHSIVKFSLIFSLSMKSFQDNNLTNSRESDWTRHKFQPKVVRYSGWAN